MPVTSRRINMICSPLLLESSARTSGLARKFNLETGAKDQFGARK
jgi:hypothetical protein